MHVIDRLHHRAAHPLALELLLRASAILLVLVVILGLLPAIADAAA